MGIGFQVTFAASPTQHSKKEVFEMSSFFTLPKTWDEYLKVNSEFSDTQIYKFLGTGLYSEFNCLSISMLSAFRKHKRLIVETDRLTMCKWHDLFGTELPTIEAEAIVSSQSSEALNLRRLRKNSVFLDALGVPLWLGQKYGFCSVFKARAAIAKILHVPSFPIPAPFDYTHTKFCSVQIRGGDKVDGYWVNGELVIEGEKSSTESYSRLLEKYARNVDVVFVLSDDFQEYTKLVEAMPSKKFFSLCGEGENGYVHAEFLKLDQAEKTEALQRLVASVHISGHSSFFVGPFKANPSRTIPLLQGSKAISASTDDASRWKAN